MLDERQEQMWDAILAMHTTAEEVMQFFAHYCGLQIFDDEMWEYLNRFEYIKNDDE